MLYLPGLSQLQHQLMGALGPLKVLSLAPPPLLLQCRIHDNKEGGSSHV